MRGLRIYLGILYHYMINGENVLVAQW
uniref:Uncharacterized protein n=1 Tax=Arundo donax TaxID=35708 RepID=A0A0A8ZZZ7_ARUDO